ncbi:protein of unknown function [Citrobacter amalonaticus]|uniref:Uncharacterized protein n=1 Tax=Citrobacter amalonaticus TaxID=35703 RepID=A0AAX2BJ58_CITAM|nr:protein of unknown function [Citrobacter amalonaticus]SAZ92263.1 protein of unknown function [Citrobacter amalonaticus]
MRFIHSSLPHYNLYRTRILQSATAQQLYQACHALTTPDNDGKPNPSSKLAIQKKAGKYEMACQPCFY